MRPVIEVLDTDFPANSTDADRAEVRALADYLNGRLAAGADPAGIAGVAKRIGYSRSTLSTYLAGKYPAKSDAAIEAAIMEHLATREERP